MFNAWHDCHRCKGTGGRYSQGRNKRWITCTRCNGSKKDPEWYSQMCKGCINYIDISTKWRNSPQYCKTCLNRDHFKPCRRSRCNKQVKYKVSWTNVRDYCSKFCENVQDYDCKGCGAYMTYNPHGKSKRYEYCRNCSDKELTKPCNNSGLGCTGTVKYKASWQDPPSLCSKCYGNIVKGGKAAKSCADCKTIIYVPANKNFRFCRNCSQKPANAVTQLNYTDSSGNPAQHTTYALKGGVRRSFNSDKGKNVRDDHFSDGSTTTDRN